MKLNWFINKSQMTNVKIWRQFLPILPEMLSAGLFPPSFPLCVWASIYCWLPFSDCLSFNFSLSSLNHLSWMGLWNEMFSNLNIPINNCVSWRYLVLLYLYNVHISKYQSVHDQSLIYSIYIKDVTPPSQLRQVNFLPKIDNPSQYVLRPM